MVLVLVRLSCYNKLPQTGWLNNKHLFLSVLEAEKSRVELPENLVSGENLFPVSKTAVFSLCPHVAERLKGLLYKGTNFTLLTHQHGAPVT